MSADAVGSSAPHSLQYASPGTVAAPQFGQTPPPAATLPSAVSSAVDRAATPSSGVLVVALTGVISTGGISASAVAAASASPSVAVSFAPHSSQNVLSSGFSFPQLGHLILYLHFGFWILDLRFWICR